MRAHFLLGLLLMLLLGGVANAGDEPGGSCVRWWWRFGHWCPDVPICPCYCDDYCRKAPPPIPCPVPCGCDDYCRKGLPPIPCPVPCGCDDYQPKCCPLPIPACCFPWYTCDRGAVGQGR